jgi:hypothetical protein
MKKPILKVTGKTRKLGKRWDHMAVASFHVNLCGYFILFCDRCELNNFYSKTCASVTCLRSY